MNDTNKQGEEPPQHGLTMADLVNLLRPLLLPANKLTPREALQSIDGSQFRSHFGGRPYFEAGEDWPTTQEGQPLDFILQIVASEDVTLPAGIAVLQLFYSWESFAWDTEADGWLVKTYAAVSAEQAQVIERPASLDEPIFCDIGFTPIQSLPDWGGLNELAAGADAVALAETLNAVDPWDAYDEAVTQLLGEGDYQSILGGYPRWLQGAENPVDAIGHTLPLLFQLDSEHEAGIMWGDSGLVYVFYDPQRPGYFTFELQCV
ncbi:DUF1963 domain-containing protein [Hymenobacter profundi]|uniref:DUF1963 domain-containing protein n=1 Tax=Hymenobacter profundi TaxID=1982110 RepID=A0ABS6WUL1_9BACT|nr:DUF1963 domain-containing protein [Hymenobacter profundi]MBW3127266.1 DUF1963 domain-containing protein [Hymenobacter profundi]